MNFTSRQIYPQEVTHRIWGSLDTADGLENLDEGKSTASVRIWNPKLLALGLFFIRLWYTGSQFFFFVLWHHSPLWALACRTISFHFFLSATNSLHFLTHRTWRSLSTSSFLLFLGLPFLLVPSTSSVKIFLGNLSSSILSRWPKELILCPFIHFTIISPCSFSVNVHASGPYETTCHICVLYNIILVVLDKSRLIKILIAAK